MNTSSCRARSWQRGSVAALLSSCSAVQCSASLVLPHLLLSGLVWSALLWSALLWSAGLGWARLGCTAVKRASRFPHLPRQPNKDRLGKVRRV